MADLIIRGGRVVDPLNHVDRVCDIAVEDGKVAEIGEELPEAGAREVFDARGKIVIPGVIDMHTHQRTQLGHPHAQRMTALAGTCTALDMAGPLDDILDSIPGSGSGINVAVLEAAREGYTIKTGRPGKEERAALIDRTLEHGGLGIKLLGGHFPMDTDICSDFISECAERGAWVAWHVGNTLHGSNIEGFRDAIDAADGKFLHIAHVNSYCRGQVVKGDGGVREALEAIERLKAHPNIFSESYLSDLNGTRLTIGPDGKPASHVTSTCLQKVGCTPDRAGMEKAILEGRVGVLVDNGTIGVLASGEKALEYWREKGTVTTGSFSVNPAPSRFLLAQAKRDDGSFVVDSFSTDGGTYPRNVIVRNGMHLVHFGALTLKEFVLKASVNGAKALGLPSKGQLGVGADADVTVIDYDRCEPYGTIVGGRVIMKDGALLGSGTTIVCDARGEAYLKGRGIRCLVKKPLDPADVPKRVSAKSL
ncbi:MAG: amidohydrolase family protein [Sutterellaceae bacterium]|nr:amidohydrolase family protein [Sutterellaceae bacterium]MDD7441009.1 amidohydrolase family protein [Sutterellaceae bacterium]MDY2867956.1 amidohydrolase family protein [Mesosutterella sp.]